MTPVSLPGPPSRSQGSRHAPRARSILAPATEQVYENHVLILLCVWSEYCVVSVFLVSGFRDIVAAALWLVFNANAAEQSRAISSQRCRVLSLTLGQIVRC